MNTRPESYRSIVGKTNKKFVRLLSPQLGSTLDDGTLLLIPVQPRRHPGDRAHEKPTLATGWVSGSFFLFQREFAERYLDDSRELLLDQLPLQRVARDGQRGIFDYGGF
jgi:hypothetical protein